MTTTTGNNATVDSTDANKATSGLVTFTKNLSSTYAATKNFGIVISQGTLTIHKKDAAGNNLQGVTFRIEKN